MRGYLDEISRTDISRVNGVDRNPSGVRRLLASLARNTAAEAGASTLAADTADPAGAASALAGLVCCGIEAAIA